MVRDEVRHEGGSEMSTVSHAPQAVCTSVAPKQYKGLTVSKSYCQRSDNAEVDGIEILPVLDA